MVGNSNYLREDRLNRNLLYNFSPVCFLYFHYVRYTVCLEVFMAGFVFLSPYNLKCQFLCSANRDENADTVSTKTEAA